MADIMHAWGYKQGLTEDDIMWAVKEHMQHADGTMRFGVTSDRRGNAVIKVLPRRGAESTPQTARHSRRSKGERKTPEKEPPPSAHTTIDKLSMALDDLIPSRRRSVRAAKGDGHEPSSQRRDWQSWERNSAWEGWQESGGGRSREGSSSGWSARGSQTEHIHRWIGWVLRTGYRDLGLHLVDGDAVRLDDLAAAARVEHSEFGFFDAKGLKKFLQDTDQEGRFDVDAKWQVRKIPRGERSTWGWSGGDSKWRSW